MRLLMQLKHLIGYVRLSIVLMEALTNVIVTRLKMVINAYHILTLASNGQSKKSVSVLDPVTVNNREDLKFLTRVLTRLTSTSNLPI
jgi:hypothetical protein